MREPTVPSALDEITAFAKRKVFHLICGVAIVIVLATCAAI